MPGIESFGRRKPASDSPEKIPIKPDELANVLLLKVLADAPTILDSYNDRFKRSPTFQANRFERQKFIYLAAGVAIALTNAAQKQSAILQVIAAFRSRVRLTMQQSWGDAEKDSDSEIEEAASDYARLVFTDPEKDKGPNEANAEDRLDRDRCHSFLSASLKGIVRSRFPLESRIRISPERKLARFSA